MLALHQINGAIYIFELLHPYKLWGKDTNNELPLINDRKKKKKKKVENIFVFTSPRQPHNESEVHYIEHPFGIALHPFCRNFYHNFGKQLLVLMQLLSNFFLQPPRIPQLRVGDRGMNGSRVLISLNRRILIALSNVVPPSP
jgi:hypothetical protein